MYSLFVFVEDRCGFAKYDWIFAVCVYVLYDCIYAETWKNNYYSNEVKMENKIEIFQI